MASLSPRTCGAEGCVLPQGHQDLHRSASGHRWPWSPIAGPDRDDLEEARRAQLEACRRDPAEARAQNWSGDIPESLSGEYGQPAYEDELEEDDAGQIRLGHDGEQRAFPGLSEGPPPARYRPAEDDPEDGA